MKQIQTDGQTDIRFLAILKKEFIIRIAYIYKYIYPILIMGSTCTPFVHCVCLSVLDNPTNRQSLQFIFSQSAKLKL